MRYKNIYTGQIAKVSSDRGVISIKERYGTRQQTFKLKHRDQVHFYLSHRGFEQESVWECDYLFCDKVERNNPCRLVSFKNPSGDCLLYPKAQYPNREQQKIVFKRLQ